MLAVVAGGVSYYSIRKTGELLDIGVHAHVRCTIAGMDRGTSRGLGAAFAAMPQAISEVAGREYKVVSAQSCDVDGRAFMNVGLNRGQTAVSLLLTLRRDQEIFPRALAGRVVQAAGIGLHEERRDGYSVVAFESGAYLGYVVSAQPDPENSELAVRVAPVMDRFAKL